MSNPHDPPHTQRLALIAAWALHWSNHDVPAVAALFTESLVYEDVPTHRVSHDAAELDAFMTSLFQASSDVRYEVHHALVDGERGAAEWTMQGTHNGPLDGLAATGKRFKVRGLSTFEFKGDKISRCSDYWSLSSLLAALGVQPRT